MSDDNENTQDQFEEDQAPPVPSERDSLVARAAQLGLKHHHKAGVDKLRALVNEALNPTATPELDEELTDKQEAEAAHKAKKEALFAKKRAATKLIRCRITCMNPNKKEWDGEIFAAGNRHIGNIKKYIPFGNDDGWHVPAILLNVIRSKKMQQFTEKRGPNGDKIKVGKLVNEYAVEVLPDLTPKQLEDLAAVQALAKAGQD